MNTSAEMEMIAIDVCVSSKGIYEINHRLSLWDIYCLYLFIQRKIVSEEAESAAGGSAETTHGWSRTDVVG